MAQTRPHIGWLDLFWLPEPSLIQLTPCYRPSPRINYLSRLRAHHPPKASNRATALLLAAGTSVLLTAHRQSARLVCPCSRGQRATARSLGSVFFEEVAPDSTVAACVSSRSSNQVSLTSSCMIPLTPLSLVAVAHVSSCWIQFPSHCWVSRSLLLFTALLLGVGDRCRGRALLNIFFDLLDRCTLPSDSSNLYRSTKSTI